MPSPNTVRSFRRTIRIQTGRHPGPLAQVLSAAAELDVEVADLQTVTLESDRIERELECLLYDEAHLERLQQMLTDMGGVKLMNTDPDVFAVHRGGKIRTRSRALVETLEGMKQVYNPGMAHLALHLQKSPEDRHEYTALGHQVAIVTDGTAVMGLGDLGPIPAMPVMEGKAVLLDQFVGLSGIPILLNTRDPDEIVQTVQAIAPSFGGIQLEDISGPRCFHIMDALERSLSVPVMHDDQHGAATAVLAAIMSACRRLGRNLKDLTVGQIGLGAAGYAIGRLMLEVTEKPILGTDIVPAAIDQHVAAGGRASTLDQIMAEADLVIAATVSKEGGGVIDPKAIRPGQIIFALSNPHPEIEPEVAEAHGAAMGATGRIINNALAYPGIWKGALDARAPRITSKMLIATAETLAALGTQDKLLPDVLDRSVHAQVAAAVAKIAHD